MIILYLCESTKVYLRPYADYRFVVSDSCPECVELAAVYGYEPADLSTWESEGGLVRPQYTNIY